MQKQQQQQTNKQTKKQILCFSRLSEGDEQVSFVSWMAFGVPVAVLNLALTWLWLQLMYFGVKNTLLCRPQTSAEEDSALEKFLRREHKKLGSMRYVWRWMWV